MNWLAPQTGCAFTLDAGDALEVVCPISEQVADLAFFARADPRDYFSPGRTLDYNQTLSLTVGATLYSHRSTALVTIDHDDCGRHDYSLAPCSLRMFQILRNLDAHPSCHGNLVAALAQYGIMADDVQGTFNAFMNVSVAANGKIEIRPPSSKAGDRLVLRALVDLIVGVTACSSEYTNNGVCKPIAFNVSKRK